MTPAPPSPTASAAATTTPITDSAALQATVLPTATPFPCADQPLGAARDFTVFVLGDLNQQGSESRGRVAVGGNVALVDYSVGLGLRQNVGSRGALIAGGNVSYANGAVAGGDLIYGGTLDMTAVDLRGGQAYQGTALDFAANAAYLRQAAGSWARLPGEGPAPTGDPSALELRGDDPALNVFALSSDDLAQAGILTIAAPPGATALINVSGEAPVLADMLLTLEGLEASHVLFNLHQANRVVMGGTNLPGTVLAPSAAISFNDGGMDGTLIGASLEGTGETRLAPFAGCLPSAGSPPEQAPPVAPSATPTATQESGPAPQPPTPTTGAPEAPAPTATAAPTAPPPTAVESDNEERERPRATPTPAPESTAPAETPSAGATAQAETPPAGATAQAETPPAGGVTGPEGSARATPADTSSVPASLPNTGGATGQGSWPYALAIGLIIGGALLVRWSRGQ